MDERTRARAIDMASVGVSYRRIALMVGVDESTVRRDVEVRRARVAADPHAHSVTVRASSIACRVRSATELIDAVARDLEAIGADYVLCDADRRRLLRVLDSAAVVIEGMGQR